MVLPISGFLPVPLPMMIPFMGAQSLVIGKMFGEGFQYGKRKISAMPNEEFNKLTFEAMMSNARSEMQASIPTMQQAMQDMKPMVETVVHEFTNYLSLVIEKAPQQLGQIKTSLEDVSGFTELNAKLVKLIADAKGTSQSQDVLGDILVALGLERFGQSAGAEDMPTSQTVVNLTGTSQITGKKVGDTRTWADYQRFLKEQEAIKKARAERVKAFGSTKFDTSKGVIQQAAERTGQLVKPKAGQTQRQARQKLITDIKNVGMSSTSRFTSSTIRNARKGQLMRLQAALAKLIQRYRW